jgi:hypothetical protein
MSFLYPAFLLGALAVALPIVLHLMRRDVAPEVPFSAVRLLRRSPIDRTRRRRLRDLLLLTARVAALALLAAAFARPYLSSSAQTPGLRIVAIDRSFSMDAPGTFARALDLARTAVDEAAGDESVAVIAFDDRAEVVSQPGSAAEARAALAALKPGFGATRYAPAIAKAIELAGDGPARVAVISDLQRSGWEDEHSIAVPAAIRIEARDAAGQAIPNAAVVQVQVEADQVVATVSNSGGAPFAGEARVDVDGRRVATARITVPPDDEAEIAVPYRTAGRGTLVFAIDDSRGYPADNSRHVSLEPPTPTRVMIVRTAGTPQSGLFLSRALEAAEDHPFELRIASGADVSAMAAEEASKNAAIVLLSTRGLDRRGRDLLVTFLRGGGGLLIAAGDDVETSMLSSTFGWAELGAVERPALGPMSIAASDVQHPIFRPFGPSAANLGQIRVERTWRLNPQGWEVAARFTDGTAALVERQVERGRAMIFASDLDRRWNEFPLHPAFVPFAVESVRHLANARKRRHEYLVAEAPAGTKPAPGVYKLGDGRSVAINVDARESAAERITAGEFGDMLSATRQAAPASVASAVSRAQTAESAQNLWRYGLFLMLGALVLESAVGRK